MSDQIHIGGGPKVEVAKIDAHGQLLAIENALSGNHGPDQQRIAEVGANWLQTILAKNRDYGSSAWQRPVLAPHLSPGDAILCRMSDKVARLARLVEGHTGAVDESLADTMCDLGAYCLLWLARPDEFEDL